MKCKGYRKRLSDGRYTWTLWRPNIKCRSITSFVHESGAVRSARAFAERVGWEIKWIGTHENWTCTIA